MRARWFILISFFLLAVLFSAIWGAPVSLLDIWSSDPTRADIARRIFLELRPTRLLAGLLVGASLAVSGATLQNVFRNPLAEPYLLGISAGGALGATLSKVLPGAHFFSQGRFDLTTLFAFAGALGASFAIYILGKTGPGRRTALFDRTRLLLIGVAMSAFLAALMSLVVALSSQADLARQITFWLLGGLSEARPSQNFALVICLLLGMGTLLVSARDLNALRAGDEEATSLGVDVEKLHARLLLVCALLSAAAVACAGLIGFVGLLGPHLVRLVVGNDARLLIPASALSGAALLVLCDAVARGIVSPQELPVGIVTALLGVPLFIFLAQRKAWL